MLFIAFSCSDTGAGTETPEAGEDSKLPQITKFDLPGDNKSDTATISVSITDDGTAVAWMITETPTAPAADSAGCNNTDSNTDSNYFFNIE